jgi:hypothetical protein
VCQTVRIFVTEHLREWAAPHESNGDRPIPMIRSHKLLVVGLPGLVLCIALPGCSGEPIFRLRGATTVESEWLGEYDGTATAQVYATGSVYSDVTGHITIERVAADSAQVSVSVGVSPRPDDLEEMGDFTGGTLGTAGVGWDLKTPLWTVVTSVTLTITYHDGARRNRLSLSRSGGRLTGLLYVDSQDTEGMYEVLGEIEVDVSRQQ